jgi:adenylate cyclase
MAEEGFKRKLTSIFSADAVGYSRLMGDDEAATVRTLTSYRNIISSLIKQHNGTVIDSPGDNLLAEFASIVDAVQCAAAVQKEIKVQNDELPENRRMQFRIGINLGDVIQEEGRIYGDGVNIAARLEGLAETGGICISRTAYDQVKNKLELGYEYLGEHSVKNIIEPVRVYRVLMEPEAAGKVIGEKRKTKKWMPVAAAVVLLIGLTGWYLYLGQTKQIEPVSEEQMAFPLPDKPSIAVLPFANMSNVPEQEYFIDGLTEQIITTLSKNSSLFVISRISTFTYKGKSVKVQQVSQDLGVRYVLEGSVQKAGDQLRVTAQLIDATMGKHLWAEHYERDMAGMFDLQDELTLKIAKSLAIKLTEGEKLRMRSIGTQNIKAAEKLTEATGYLRNMNKESNAVARQLTEESIALDPQFAQAYSVLATTHVMDVWLGSSKSPRTSYEQATKFLQKSIVLDANLDLPHALLGHIYSLQRKYEIAIAEGEKAIALNPNSDTALVFLAMTMDWVGRSEEAIAMYQKAMRLSPDSPGYYYLNLGHAYRSLDRCEDAIIEYKKTLKLTPNNVRAHIALVICYCLLGRYEDARIAATEALKIYPKLSFIQAAKKHPYKNPDITARFLEALRKAGLS